MLVVVMMAMMVTIFKYLFVLVVLLSWLSLWLYDSYLAVTFFVFLFFCFLCWTTLACRHKSWYSRESRRTKGGYSARISRVFLHIIIPMGRFEYVYIYIIGDEHKFVMIFVAYMSSAWNKYICLLSLTTAYVVATLGITLKGAKITRRQSRIVTLFFTDV